MIRVGRCTYDKRGARQDPAYPGFQNIVVLTKGTNRWGMLGPYELKNEQGHIMENIWQFSKTYPQVEATCQRKSRFENIIVWDHPSEIHVIDPTKPATADNLTPAYWAWRQKGFSAPYAVRYPPGYGKMASCVGLLAETRAGQYEGPLGYVEARKQLYLPLYTRMARQSPLFAKLRELREKGKNLLIVEVDGPHQESLGHYVQTYGVGADFIAAGTMLANAANLKIMLDDPQHPFGHGYCLAAALAGIDLLAGDEKMPGPEAAPPALADFTDEDLDAALADLLAAQDVEYHLRRVEARAAPPPPAPND